METTPGFARHRIEPRFEGCPENCDIISAKITSVNGYFEVHSGFMRETRDVTMEELDQEATVVPAVACREA